MSADWQWNSKVAFAAGIALVLVGAFGLTGRAWVPFVAAVLAAMWLVRIAVVWQAGLWDEADRVFSEDTLRTVLIVQGLPSLFVMAVALFAFVTELRIRRRS